MSHWGTRQTNVLCSSQAQLLHSPTAAKMSEPAPVTLQQVEDRLGTLRTDATVPLTVPVVIVISGPSGVGKDAVIQALEQAQPGLHFVVTATSRGKRKGEVDGKDYHFVSKEQFESWIKAGELLEHAVVYGEYKGIPRQQVTNALARGTDVVMRIDVQGAATIRRLMPDAIFVFLVAESERTLVSRLVQRKTEPLESMLVRVQTAKEEVEHVADFDYVVVNHEGKLKSTVGQIAAIIEAEKLAVRRRMPQSAASNQRQ